MSVWFKDNAIIISGEIKCLIIIWKITGIHVVAGSWNFLTAAAAYGILNIKYMGWFSASENSYLFKCNFLTSETLIYSYVQILKSVQY